MSVDFMRIAVVAETFNPFNGGSAKRYYEVLKRLVGDGYEIDLFTVRLSKHWAINENIDGINIHRTERPFEDFITEDGFRSITKVLLYSSWASKKVSENNYHIIESNHCPIFPVIGTWLASKLSKTPLSVTFHEAWHSQWYWHVPNKLYAPFGITLEKLYVKMPDIGIAVSKTTATRLISLLNMNKEKVVTIPNGVDLNLFNSVKSKKEDYKIIYVGRLNPHKRVDWLIDALNYVRRMYEVHLEVVGDGPMRCEYEAYVKKKNLEKHVTFLGPLDNKSLVERLKQAYIYVLPSIREGQSITTLEAMAAGTPQIVVNVDGNGAAELLKESRSGLIAKPNPFNIANQMMGMLNDRSLWLELQRNGYNFVQDYDWSKIAEMYSKVYDSLA